MSIENQIVEYLNLHQEVSVNELQGQIPASRQMLHRILSRMLQEGYLQKLGRAPIAGKVFGLAIVGSFKGFDVIQEV